MGVAVVPNQAERNALAVLLAQLSTANLRLYANDYSPVAGTVIGDLTEANFTGYAAVNGSWGSISTGGDGKAVTVGGPFNFTVGSSPSVGNLIYGWYLTSNSGLLLAAERLSTDGLEMASEGQQISLVTVTLKVYEGTP